MGQWRHSEAEDDDVEVESARSLHESSGPEKSGTPDLTSRERVIPTATALPRKGQKKLLAASQKEPQDQSSSAVGLVFWVAVASLSAALFTLRGLRKRRKASGGAKLLLEPEDVQDEAALAEGGAAQLAGRRLICSALFDLEDRKSRHAEAAGTGRTAEAIAALLRAGAVLKGRTVSEELYLGLLGDPEDAVNPAAPECSISGCSSAAAAVLASGLADIGLGADSLGGIRVQSALFGLSGFRPTPGHLPMGGATLVTGGSGSVGWLAADPALHAQLADVFKLPGARGSFSNTDLVELVIASEVFELHGAAGSRLKKVALAAGRRWAGADQTASGLLVSYLRKNVPSYKHFVGFDNDADDVLEGVLRAAVTLEYVELLQQHGHLLEEPAALRPSVLEQFERAQEINEEEVLAAEQVAAETSRAMRAILKGVVLIIPTLPAPQPAQGSGATQLKKWERETLQLAAIATLTGCPQVTLPVPSAGGEPPLSLSLLSLPKTDQRLAHVAAALGPLVLLAASAKPANGSKTAAPKPSPAASSLRLRRTARSSWAAGAPAANGLTRSPPGDASAQEAHRQAGNDAFKAGRYQDAIEEYSLAIKASPSASASIIYSNRAQALIKVGQYKEAERDCNKALQAGPNAKALLRRGTARAAVSNLEGAAQDFKHVLALEPSNRQARMELQNLKQLSYYGGLDESGLDNMLAGMSPGTARSNLSF